MVVVVIAPVVIASVVVIAAVVVPSLGEAVEELSTALIHILTFCREV